MLIQERLTIKNKLLSDRARHVTDDVLNKRKERQDNTRERQDTELERLFIRVDVSPGGNIDAGRSLPSVRAHASTPTGMSSSFSQNSFSSTAASASAPTTPLGTRSTGHQTM
jgi:hypothetical protein